ncbi:S41 family peptidase [Sphingobacterium thalpophilum]|uniref:S41 family peptidase n=1 Tax=Sphingobacterium thalpophilum TaxID=259 RepID=A0ABV4H8N9_9SPHI
MNKMPLQQLGRWAAIALIGLSVLSCKKDEPKPEPEPTDRTEGQLIKDDIYKYYKLYSVWADESIPDYLDNPAQYTDQWSSANEVLYQLRKLTPQHIEEGYNDKVFDRFSFMDGLNGYNTGEHAGLKMDNNEGYGISIQWLSVDDGKTARPYISFVEGGSPAQVAGFRRSDIISSINDDTETYAVEVDCPTTRCTIKDPQLFTRLNNNIQSALDGATLKLQVKRQDQLFTKTISYSNSYVINPVYKDTVYSYSGNNIGYLALSSFEEIENNNSNQQNINAAFAQYESKQIKSLIVDLRYNGGGYVDAAIYIADKIGGAKTKGKLMLTYEMNKYMQSDAAKNLRDQLAMHDTYFEGLSALNLNKVYFLVSEQTASAAEMLINVLTPHMTVQIIADGARTYGKPVGFFEQKVRDKVSYWPASFILKNSRGNLGEKYNKGTVRDLRDYWDGLVPDKFNILDDVSAAVGDPAERMLATALADAAPTTSTKAALQRVSSRSMHMLEQGKISTLPERGMFKRMK